MGKKLIRKKMDHYNAIRNRVIEYYETVANRSKTATVRHFRKEVQYPRFIYVTISRYEQRKIKPFVKKQVGPPMKSSTKENIRRYGELYKMDPSITNSEAAQLMNIKRSAIGYIRAMFHKVLNATDNSSRQNGEISEMHSDNGDDHFGGADDDFHQPSSPTTAIEMSASATAEPVVKKEATFQQSKCRKKGRCVLCLEPCYQGTVTEEGTTLREMTDNLNVIFVLKLLLDLKSDEIIDIMDKSGGRNPKDWVSFCDQCRSLMKKAIDIQQQIRKLETQMAEIKEKVVENIKIFAVEDFKKRKKGNLFLTNKVRELVGKREPKSNQHHHQTNPFQEGDKQAESVLRKMGIPNIPVKVEMSEVPRNTLSDMEYLNDDDFHLNDDDPNPLETQVDNNCDFVGDHPSRNEMGAVGFGVEASSSRETPIPTCSAKLFSTETESTVALGNDNELGKAAGSMLAPILTVPIPTQGLCDICGLNFRPLAIPMHKFKEHKVVMEGFTVKRCSFKGCNYETLFEGHLQMHMKKHDTSTTYTCSYCGRIFFRKMYLQRHEEIHKNAGTRPYQCDLCGSSYAVKNYLYLHQRLAHEKRPFGSTNKRKRQNQEGI